MTVEKSMTNAIEAKQETVNKFINDYEVESRLLDESIEKGNKILFEVWTDAMSKTRTDARAAGITDKEFNHALLTLRIAEYARKGQWHE